MHGEDPIWYLLLPQEVLESRFGRSTVAHQANVDSGRSRPYHSTRGAAESLDLKLGTKEEGKEKEGCQEQKQVSQE